MNNAIRRAIRAHHLEQHVRGDRAKWLAVLPFAIPLATVVAMSEAVAQPASEASAVRVEEVIVSARRKDEFLQDVPLTVNVVDEKALSNLNIRKLEDLQSVVAGLTLSEDPIAPAASIRGVRFDAFASGNNPTVEFYLNDSPIVSSVAVQGLFDISQIEVLRGPQGTLRGRASPSGSINITSTQPDLEEFGGYVDYTTTNIDSTNMRGALNLPIIRDVLAFRVAGYREENDGDGVRSFNNHRMSAYDSDGYRTSLRFNPADTLTFNLMYQRLKPERRTYTQVESALREDSSASGSAISIRPGDRRAIASQPSSSEQILERTGFDVAWELNDSMTINYAGALTELETTRDQQDDTAGFFPLNYPNVARLQDFGQQLRSEGKNESHELRLTAEFDRADFVLGALYQNFNTANRVTQFTPVFLGPLNSWLMQQTNVVTGGAATEQSVFGNFTFHFTDDTEASFGLRYIDFENESDVVVGTNTVSDVAEHYDKVVYMLSAKHTFSPELMAYATLGSSWRPGISTVGNFSTNQTAREQSFVELPPETSESLELGVKSSMMDGQLRLSAATFYQKFDNYPYRSGGNGVYYITTDTNGVESVSAFNFVAAAPVNVYGLELEAVYQATPNWNVSGLYSWAKGELDNATIPCNDYLPADGSPDSSGAIPTVGDIDIATGGDNVAACQANSRANFAPLWTATLQSEYSFPLQFVGAEAFVRGLVTLYGKSQNDPSNSLDDVSSYNLVNLYAGLRSDNETWEVMFYGKNIFETERVLERGANEEDISYQHITSFSPLTRNAVNGTAGYRSVTLTDPREFGVNLRYNF